MLLLADRTCTTVMKFISAAFDIVIYRADTALSLSLSLSVSLLQAVLIPHWGWVSHMGSPSPFVSVISILWFEAKCHQVLLQHIRPSLLLTSLTPTTIHFSFHDLFDTTIIFSSLHVPIPSYSLASRILSMIQGTPTACRISSFLFLSLSETPSIQRSILISVLSKSSSSFRLANLL